VVFDIQAGSKDQLFFLHSDSQSKIMEENKYQSPTVYYFGMPVFRGEIINNVTDIEDLMNEIISIHFCPYNVYVPEGIRRKRFTEILYLVVIPMPQKAKENTLLSIMQINYPILFRRINKVCMEKFQCKFPKALEKIRTFRNNLAHRNYEEDQYTSLPEDEDETEVNEGKDFEAFYYYEPKIVKNKLEIQRIKLSKKDQDHYIEFIQFITEQFRDVYWTMTKQIWRERPYAIKK